MTNKKCFDCGKVGYTEKHHVVPKSFGGLSTVDLCENCHGKVHDTKRVKVGQLTKYALEEKSVETYGAVGLAIAYFFKANRYYPPFVEFSKFFREVWGIGLDLMSETMIINRYKRMTHYLEKEPERFLFLVNTFKGSINNE